MTLDKYPSIKALYESLNTQFPYFVGVIQKQMDSFGEQWLSLFEEELEVFFGNDKQKLNEAVTGYGKFSLDSMKLQVKFQKTKEYGNKTYAEAASEVYQNKDYMFDLYLPGILLSHYLWRHHFIQHIFFLERFLPLISQDESKTFYDIGVGTGFYSKEMLRCTRLDGKGFDMSPYSLEHTLNMLRAHNLADRYEACLRDIVKQPVTPAADYLVNIEVLEHLEEPQLFLNFLTRMLKPGGYGIISAAITAPNADHIFLYHNSDQVASQLVKAGFKIVDSTVDNAYDPRSEKEVVPVNAAFIVTI